MTIICFQLSMPNNNSWNGKWSGDGNLYVRTRKFSGKAGLAKAESVLAKKSYYYNFGDGWGASVAVKKVSATERRKLDKNTKGFCGYDWMIDSIMQHGDIVLPERNRA